MTIRVGIEMCSLEWMLILAQSWQSNYLGEGYILGIEPSQLGDRILISASPLSDRQRGIYFSTLSRLIDEYLIAGQFREAWPATAFRLGCHKDVLDVYATISTTRRIENSNGALFDLRPTSSGNAARSAAHLTFYEVLNQNIGLLDCDLDSCGRRFIFGTDKRTRFCGGKCRRIHHKHAVHERQRRFRNSRRIEIAIAVITQFLKEPTGNWMISVLTAWAQAEQREMPIIFEATRRRPPNRVPNAPGCRHLHSCIEVALDQENLDLLQKLVKQCCDGSLEEEDYIKHRIALLSQLICKVIYEAKTIPEDRVEAMFEIMEKMRRKEHGYC